MPVYNFQTPVNYQIFTKKINLAEVKAFAAFSVALKC